MLSNRAMQQAVRRLAAKQPSMGMSNAFAPASALILRRPATSVAQPKAEIATPKEGMQILVNQRLHRPVSPHLSIYQPQITWYLSILNRITGSVLSGGFYIFGALYLAAPLVGWQITSAGMAAAFAKWPLILKVLAKMTVAWPFTFHSWNGIRHLMWDVGYGLTNNQVKQSGWFVVGLSTVTAAALLFL